MNKVWRITSGLSLGVLIITLQACTSASDSTWFAYNYQPQNGMRGSVDNVAVSAQQGNPRAQYTLANRYYYGLGVRQNHGLARKWMGKAARQGYAPAKVAYHGMLNPRRVKRYGYGSGRRYSGGPVRNERGYHLAQGGSPTKHKDRDKQWIYQQSPNGYTIELANDAKRSSVAGVLHKTPKNARSAQYKYGKDGDKRYSGVYGTFKSREEAEKAMKNLPASVRDSAKLKRWGDVQSQARKAAAGNSESGANKPEVSKPVIE